MSDQMLLFDEVDLDDYDGFITDETLFFASYNP
jgi:hypothetical protein